MKTKLILAFVCIVAVIAAAQTSKPATSKAAKPPASSTQAPAKSASTGAASGVPSRATAESFLRHVFGWDTTMKITVKDVKQSPSPSLAQIDVHVETPKGPQDNSLFITPDQKNAVLGQLIPFGGQPAVKPTNDQIDAFVKKMVAGNPGLSWTVGEIKPNALSTLTEVVVVLSNPQGQRGAQRFWVTPDGQYALVGDNSPFSADPYGPALAELKRGINGPAKGPATAPVLIVEFGDLECPACKAAVPTVERLLKDVPNVRFVFQQFPLVQIHHWAYKAAAYGDCIARQNTDAFWKFMDAAYAAQEDITSHVETNSANKNPDLSYAEQKLTDLATQVGMNGKQIAACAADPATTARVDRSMALGTSLEVTGTPTLFINGRRIANLGGMQYETLKAMVQFAATLAAK